MLAALPFSARAQRFQFLHEIDTYYKFDPNLRIYFQAKDPGEGGMPTTAEIGPSLEFHLKPHRQPPCLAGCYSDHEDTGVSVTPCVSLPSNAK